MNIFMSKDFEDKWGHFFWITAVDDCFCIRAQKNYLTEQISADTFKDDKATEIFCLLLFLSAFVTSALMLQSVTEYLRLTLFSCGIAHYGRGLIAIFRNVFAGINEFFILGGGGGGWALGYPTMGFRHFPYIS